VYLHVFPQRTGVCIALVTAAHLTIVRLVTRVHVTVFLPVGTVREPSVAAFELTLKRLLTWRRGKNNDIIIIT